MEKKCNICHVTSLAAEFYVGLSSRCKECHKMKSRENRAANADEIRRYDAKRFQNDPKVRERHRRYQATPAGKLSMMKSRKKWLSNHPAKRAAHLILGNAVRDGKIAKPSNCQICNGGGKIHGHHDDYTKPLDVIWCCPKCHTEIHRNAKQK